jgi:hypothetical protein
MPPKELPASLCLRSANSMTFSNNISFSNKLIVEYLHMQCSFRSHLWAQQYQPLPNPSAAYQTNHLTSSCPSTFQLVVASVVRLPNAKLARIKHPSSNKSSCTSGFNCQFIVESDFEGAQAYDVSSDSIYHCHWSLSLPLSSLPRSKSTFIVVSVDYYHRPCRYHRRRQV